MFLQFDDDIEQMMGYRDAGLPLRSARQQKAAIRSVTAPIEPGVELNPRRSRIRAILTHSHGKRSLSSGSTRHRKVRA